MKNEKGITIVTLVITIVIMIILAGVVTSNGIQSVKNAQKTVFISEMEMIQAKVNTIYEERKSNNQNLEYYNNIGQDISVVDSNKITQVLGSSTEGFKYFSKEDLRKISLDNITQDVLINFDTREVASLKGIEIDGVTYYKLKDIPNYAGYSVEYVEKNTGSPTFSVEQTKLKDGSYKFTVKDITYIGNISGGTVSYKLHSDSNWILNGDNLSFTVTNPGLYDIRFTDKAGNSTVVQKWIYVEDGLLLYLDGENNTREGNNPTSTTWEDLSDNKNDAIGYNMSSENGYYSQEEHGYVFLENASYFKTKNKIGISGDDNYTIETVMKPYSNTSNTSAPLWFGVKETEWYVGGASVPGYNSDGKMTLSFINNYIINDEAHKRFDNITSFSWRKVKKGDLQAQDNDYALMTLNGENVSSTYTGTETITSNIVDSEVEIGRGWQWNNENRTANCLINVIRIYNRALNDEEIKINYEIDQYRFGIIK